MRFDSVLVILLSNNNNNNNNNTTNTNTTTTTTNNNNNNILPAWELTLAWSSCSPSSPPLSSWPLLFFSIPQVCWIFVLPYLPLHFLLHQPHFDLGRPFLNNTDVFLHSVYVHRFDPKPYCRKTPFVLENFLSWVNQTIRWCILQWRIIVVFCVTWIEMDLEQEKIRQKFADPAGHQLVAQLSLLFEFLHWSSIFHNTEKVVPS